MPKPTAYEVYLFTRSDTDTLMLRDLPAGLPVIVQFGEKIKLTGKISRHRGAHDDAAVIGFTLTGDADSAPLSSASIRGWFADALAALLACEDTPVEVRNILSEAVNEIGNRAGAYNLDSDLARHILRRSFMVADAERRNDEQ
ncbi:MAG: hypothetical protein ACREBD_03200 [Blastocatellia bacterium]